MSDPRPILTPQECAARMDEWDWPVDPGYPEDADFARDTIAHLRSIAALSDRVKVLRNALEAHYHQEIPFHARQELARKALGADL